jgi:hypothetical protein
MSLSTAAVLKAWIHWEICSPFVPEFHLTLKLTLKVLTSGLEKPVVVKQALCLPLLPFGNAYDDNNKADI